MGIKGLSSLIKEHVPRAILKRNVNSYRGQCIGIDTNIFLYSFALLGQNNIQDKNSNNTIMHLFGILRQSTTLLESGITPVYILEGKPPIKKKNELFKRKKRVERLKVRISEAKCKVLEADQKLNELVQSKQPLKVQIEEKKVNEDIEGIEGITKEDKESLKHKEEKEHIKEEKVKENIETKDIEKEKVKEDVETKVIEKEDTKLLKYKELIKVRAQNTKLMNRKIIRITKQIVQESAYLLLLLGIPVIQAPSEAEAQCAELCKKGIIDGILTNDMDALPLGCGKVLSKYYQRKETTIEEIDLLTILKGCNITMEQFIDICILLGCDYTNTFHGIGGKSAFSFIKQYNSIEGIITHFSRENKLGGLNNFNFIAAREIFKNPIITPGEYFENHHYNLNTPHFDTALEYLFSKGFKHYIAKSLLNRYLNAHKKILFNKY